MGATSFRCPPFRYTEWWAKQKDVLPTLQTITEVIMEKLTSSGLSKARLKRFIHLEERDLNDYEWLQVDSIALTAEEQQHLRPIQSRLRSYRTHLMNEATLWARAIYPLLLLAEQGSIQAWSGVAMQATYPQFEIDGIADGVLGKYVSGFPETPYLVVVEAKRGLETSNPVYQLYGQLLAAAHLNWENDQLEPQELFGCYTIADSWSFVRAEVSGITTERPTLRIESSGEYPEQTDAPTIVKILKKMVMKYLQQTRSGE